MEYRYIASNPDGFVSQVVRYVSSGHVFYFNGRVANGKDPLATDRKLVKAYEAAQTPWTRSRNRAKGRSSVHYLRHGCRFVLLATPGRGAFFDELGVKRGRDGTILREAQFRDIRRVSFVFDIYAIRFSACSKDASRSPGRRRVLVRLNREAYQGLKSYLVGRATRYDIRSLEAQVWSLGVYPYRPVLEQLWAIVRAMNRKRRRLGLAPLEGRRCIQNRKRPLRVFDS